MQEVELSKNGNIQVRDIAYWAKPIFTTYIFEMKKQWKKFIIFSALAVVFVFLLSYLPYLLVPDNALPETQIDYFQSGLGFFLMIVIFSACFFFGGIICSEFSEKTGHIVFPIINRYKILVGKFLADYTMLMGVIATFYFSLGYLSLMYYSILWIDRILMSFGIAALYALGISSFVTLFSSLLKSVSMSIVASIMFLLIANMMIDSLLGLWLYEIEPIWSLNYMSNLVTYIMESDFASMDRYVTYTFRFGPGGGGERGQWLTPSLSGGILIALAYTAICLTLATIRFKRKQI